MSCAHGVVKREQSGTQHKRLAANRQASISRMEVESVKFSYSVWSALDGEVFVSLLTTLDSGISSSHFAKRIGRVCALAYCVGQYHTSKVFARLPGTLEPRMCSFHLAKWHGCVMCFTTDFYVQLAHRKEPCINNCAF